MKELSKNISEFPVTYEFVTRNTPVDLIRQYFLLRRKVYTEYWQLKVFSGEEDKYDRIGHILLVVQGERCIGGIRLVTHKVGSSMLLPMEAEKFRLREQFPELHLKGKKYGEIGRGTILPEFMNGKYSHEMYRLICLKSKKLGHEYAFAVAPVVQARNCRIATGSFGLRTEIRKDIVIPPSLSYENIPMHLIVIHINSWDLSPKSQAPVSREAYVYETQLFS